jgi:penicillin-binding protein 2A
MEESLPYMEEDQFSTKSVNEKLAKKELTGEIEQTIKEQAEKIEGKLRDDLPVWKEKLKEGKQELEEFGKFLKEKWGQFTN